MPRECDIGRARGVLREHCYHCSEIVSVKDKTISDGKIYHEKCLERIEKEKKLQNSLDRSEQEMTYREALRKHMGLTV